MNRIYCSGLTHAGRVRRRNEDSYCIFCPEDRPYSFAAVADGIGGHDKGEVASELCCATLLEECMRRDSFLEQPGPERQLQALQEILFRINSRINTLNTLRERLSPMGTTVCAAIFGPDCVAAVYAGDSRLYELTPHELLQRTTDQTLSEFLRSRHRLPPDAEEPKSISNVITNALGIYPEPDMPSLILPRRENCQYLLCSDGLHHVLPEERIFSVLSEAMTRHTALERLLVEVLSAGAPDNVTIVLGSAEPLRKQNWKGTILC